MRISVQHASVCTLQNLTPEAAQAQYGLRVLVMRMWPRGIRRSTVDLWMPDAGPTKGLLRSYRDQEIDWEQFKATYIQEQAEACGGCLLIYPRDPQRERVVVNYTVKPLSILAWYAQRVHSISLLCWERTGHCHREILQDLVAEVVAEVNWKEELDLLCLEDQHPSLFLSVQERQHE